MNTPRISSPKIRTAFAACCLVWGSYVIAMGRTSGFGIQLSNLPDFLYITFIFVAPLTLFSFLGLGWRRIIIGMFVVCTASFLIAEVFGRAQEEAVVRHFGLVPSEETIMVNRWWPFQHHSIFYSREYGWSGCD